MSELAVAAFAASTGEHLVDVPGSRRFDAFLSTFDEAGYRRQLAADGYAWLGRGEPAFPARLKAVHDPPPGLFLRSASREPPAEAPTVAIVGARACSAYGAEVAHALARDLAAAGVVVVSGLARGVDAAAHRGAIETGRTIAVLGCGIDRDYPRAHASLAAEIVRHGWVVSEYPPGVEPAPWRFPARNRIVAGLADVTVVVEARERSGALITADLALDEGRDVMAVPGEITSRLSKGTNHLLRLGAAPVTGVGDVFRSLGMTRPAAAAPEPLNERLQQVRAVVADAPAAADDVVRRTGLDPGAVAAALAELELLGVIGHADGLYREVMRST
jgi:DNA processing protein